MLKNVNLKVKEVINFSEIHFSRGNHEMTMQLGEWEGAVARRHGFGYRHTLCIIYLASLYHSTFWWMGQSQGSARVVVMIKG